VAETASLDARLRETAPYVGIGPTPIRRSGAGPSLAPRLKARAVPGAVRRRTAVRVEIWSDIVCPWCYIGKRRFERALEDFPHADKVEIVHRAFQLNPSAPQGAVVPRLTYLMQKYGWSTAQAEEMNTRMEKTAAGEGLVYNLSELMSGNTKDAHRLLLVAGDPELQGDLLERFYRAYFTEGRSLFDRDSLLALAIDAGMEEARVAATLESDEGEALVLADLLESRTRGITGVPFFVIEGRYSISGAQARTVFADAITRAWADTHHDA